MGTRTFAMHNRTRRVLCRIGFFTLCVVPTLFVAGLICIVRSPVYLAYQKSALERSLSDGLGLVVSIDKIKHPVRGVTELEGVELADPESGDRIALARRIETGRNGEELVLLASQSEIQGEKIRHLWEVLQDRVLRSHRSSELRAQLVAGEVTIRRADDAETTMLTGVRCRLVPTAEGPHALIEFRDVAHQADEPAQLHVTRNRQMSPPATRWKLQTGSTSFSCAMLADHVDILANLGDEATFQGSVEMTSTGRGWEGEIAGRFRQVDLDQLVTNRYSHQLSGVAEIGFQRATFAEGKLLDAIGDVTCEGGVVSWSLLDQARESLGLLADARLRSTVVDSLWPYRQLKFGFSLSAEGFDITGHCNSVGEGVVMADDNGPLLADDPQRIAQVVALVRTLASKNGEQVPATPEAHQLLDVLPIPPGAKEPELATPRRIHPSVHLEPVPH